MKIREYKPHNLLINRINPLIRFLIVSDMLIVGAVGMFAPLYALFVQDSIKDANELIIGMSISIYLVSRSIFQIPLASLLDKIKGEIDDYYFLITFTVLLGIVHLGFIGIEKIWHLFLMQFLIGMFSAITYPSYMALFTRHIDKSMEGTEWGVYYTFVDLSSAGLATFGGYVATNFGFNSLIICVSSLCILGGLTLIPIKPYIYRPTHKLY